MDASKKEMWEGFLELALEGKDFITNSSSQDPLGIFIRDVGRALFANNLAEIGEIRRMIAKYIVSAKRKGNEKMKNCLEALDQASGAYAAELGEKERDEEMVKVVAEETYRVQIMLALEDAHKAVTDLEKELASQNISLAQIKTALYVLNMADMVNAFGDQGEQVFALSLYGRRILRKIKENG